MKLHRNSLFAILGVALWCTALSSSALTLGRAKGAVLVGQSLKLAVPIRLEAGEGALPLCFDADVFYGDSRQDADRVTVTHDVSPQSVTANLYVSAQASVDEPVVTVYLRTGCENKTTRRYVLLAEPANDVVAQAKPATALVTPALAQPATAPQLPKLPSVATAQLTPATTAIDQSANKAGERPKPPKAVPVAPIASPTVLPKTPPAALKPIAQRARLKLEPLDLTEVRDPMLKLSAELPLPPVEDLGKREQASALWRSLNATPQDVLGADKRRQALEADLKSLHDVTTKNQQLLQDLSGRLEHAESQRYANPLVYGLLVFLLLCGLGLVYIWRSLSRRGLARAPWWRGDDGHQQRTQFPGGADDEVDDHDAPANSVTRRQVAPRATVEPKAPPPQPMAPRATTPVQDVDIDLFLDDVPAGPPSGGGRNPALPVQAAAPHNERAAGHQDFANSMTASFRSVNTQEMLDVRQQAEFFMTLGQHDEAVNMLKESIDASAASNPMVYLDLLKVLHTLGRKSEYDDYRNGFNAIFSGHVPLYTEFNQGGSGLEAYPDVCSRIIALWPTEEAVTLIENCLVRDDSDKGVRGFDLEAFRDLLLLHSIARRIAASLDSGFQPFSAVKSGSAETGASFMPNADGDRTQPVSVPANSAGSNALDFDLSDAPPGNLIDFDTADFVPSLRRPV